MCKINITRHAMERYAEKIKNVQKNEINLKINQNAELYKEELNKMFEQSKIIYTGVMTSPENIKQTKDDVNYRLVDNIILITDLQDTKIITLYRIEFGFGRNSDKLLLNNLLEELDEKDTTYLKSMESVQQDKDSIQYNIFQLENEIQALRESLKALEDSKKGLEEYSKSITQKETLAKADRDCIARKIIYSIHYRKAVDEYSTNK